MMKNPAPVASDRPMAFFQVQRRHQSPFCRGRPPRPRPLPPPLPPPIRPRGQPRAGRAAGRRRWPPEPGSQPDSVPSCAASRSRALIPRRGVSARRRARPGPPRRAGRGRRAGPARRSPGRSRARAVRAMAAAGRAVTAAPAGAAWITGIGIITGEVWVTHASSLVGCGSRGRASGWGLTVSGGAGYPARVRNSSQLLTASMILPPSLTHGGAWPAVTRQHGHAGCAGYVAHPCRGHRTRRGGSRHNFGRPRPHIPGTPRIRTPSRLVPVPA